MGGPWAPADLLPLNPSGDELQAAREALLLRRAAAAAEKAAKKEKKQSKAAAVNGGAAAANGAAAAAAGAPASNGGAGSKRGAPVEGSTGGAAPPPAGDAVAEAKRFKAGELKPAGADDAVWKSLFTSSSTNQGASRNDYMCRATMRRVA